MNGVDDDGTAMTAFIESGATDIGDGEQFVVKRLVPDIKFTGSETRKHSRFYFESRNFQVHPMILRTRRRTRTATSPVDKYTNQLHLRLRGRSDQ